MAKKKQETKNNKKVIKNLKGVIIMASVYMRIFTRFHLNINVTRKKLQLIRRINGRKDYLL